MIVFGLEAWKQAARYAERDRNEMGPSSFEIAQEQKKILLFLESKHDPVSLTSLKTRLQRFMEENVFIFREKRGLEKAIDEIRDIRENITRITVPGFKRFNLEWIRAIEFSWMIEGAEIIARSALFREESRGFHHRRDFENMDNERWLKHTVARFEGGRLKLDSASIVLNRMKPEE